MKICGVDPGIRGGLAVVLVHDGAAPDIVDMIDISVAGVGAKERVNVLALRAWIEQHRPDYAYIERAQAMPKQGASSGFKYGRATGSIEAVIACCEVPLIIVEPTAWKKISSASRQRQRSRTPACAAAIPVCARATCPQNGSRSC